MISSTCDKCRHWGAPRAGQDEGYYGHCDEHPAIQGLDDGYSGVAIAFETRKDFTCVNYCAWVDDDTFTT